MIEYKYHSESMKQCLDSTIQVLFARKFKFIQSKISYYRKEFDKQLIKNGFADKINN